MFQCLLTFATGTGFLFRCLTPGGLLQPLGCGGLPSCLSLQGGWVVQTVKDELQGSPFNPVQTRMPEPSNEHIPRSIRVVLCRVDETCIHNHAFSFHPTFLLFPYFHHTLTFWYYQGQVRSQYEVGTICVRGYPSMWGLLCKEHLAPVNDEKVLLIF